jgi:hypothetical protein
MVYGLRSVRENKTITSRAQVLSATQRQGELLGKAEGAGKIPARDTSVASAGSVQGASISRSGKNRTCYNSGKDIS